MEEKTVTSLTGSLVEIVTQAWESIMSNHDESPIYMIAGKGHDWFYSPEIYRMVRIPRGIEVFPLLEDQDEKGMVPCAYDGGFVMIPFDDIDITGWN